MKTARWISLLAGTLALINVALAIDVAGLKCESRIDPLGVDVTQPLLGWTLQSTVRGDRQTAYHVLVASDAAKLAAGVGDLWDSGRVESEEFVQVAYAGRALHSSQQVFWQVRAWDAGGQVSAWSPVAAWTMGVLEPAGWSAHWISAAGAERYAVQYPEAAHHDFRDRAEFAKAHPGAIPTGGPNYSSLLARREFTAKPGLVRAVVHASGLGQYEMSVNGRKVGDALLSPGWTNYQRTVLYDTYDITAQVKPGANALGLVMGNGMYNIQPDFVRYVKFLNSFGPLKAIAQLRLEYADGTVETIGTDDTWQVAPGPVTFSNIFGGEDFDARLVAAGWDQPGFQASAAWAVALETEGPGGSLKGLSAAAPPLKVMATLTPLKRTQLNANTWVYDLGQNASLMPRLRMHGPRGSSVRMIPAELLGADGFVDRTSATQDGVRPAWWQYTAADDKSVEWTPQFFYQGARYLQVELMSAEHDTALPVVEELTGLVVHTSAAPIGEFSCSSELFNRIHTLVRWAQRSNLVSIITDCPHREKLGWLEQYHLNGPSLRYNFDLNTLFRKAMNDMADAQLDNGFVPNIAPEFFGAGPEDLTNGFRNSPEWGSSIILVPWQQYVFAGDQSLLRDYYPRMKRYLAFLESTAKDHIIEFGLGDWYDLGPKPPWGSQLTPVPFTATAIYFYDNLVMAETAALLAKPDEARDYRAKAEAIRAAFNMKFFNAATGTYATGSQTTSALPLVFGLVEPEHRRKLADALVADIRARGNAFTSGDIGYRFLLQALALEGHSDVIFDMNNQSEKPGYGYQLKMGATALTEKWDAGVGNFGSQNHFMLGQINEWFYHDLAGIAPEEAAPGFRNVVIKPRVIGDLSWVNGRYDSVRGPVVTAWRREAGRFTLEARIPPGSTATVFIPAERAATVFESGRPAASAPHVKFLRQVDGCAVYAIDSGVYLFSAPVLKPKAADEVRIAPDNAMLQYTGRIDFSNPTAPALSWSASSLTARFTGPSVAVQLDDPHGWNSFNAFVDGDLLHPVVLHCQKGDHVYSVAGNLASGPHQLLLSKRTEGGNGATIFRGLELSASAQLLPPPPRPPHRMEIYGDSISCGLGNEAPDGAADNNGREENAFLTYGAIAARDLNCELHLISQSGIGVIISWFDFTMPDFYDQLSAVGNNDTRWDFSRWTPDVVVINLFQNDKWLIDKEHRIEPPPSDEARIQAYLDFVQTIRGKYPRAYIVCALGSMDATEPGSQWPGYIETAVARMKTNNPGAKIDTLFFDYTGYKAHPRVRQHEANAAKLTAFIREKLGW